MRVYAARIEINFSEDFYAVKEFIMFDLKRKKKTARIIGAENPVTRIYIDLRTHLAHLPTRARPIYIMDVVNTTSPRD